MGRKTTWKECHLTRISHIYNLQSSMNNQSKFEGWTISIEEVPGVLETNMPWSLLRTWFSFAGVPFPGEWLTADKPSWEIYAD